MGKSKQPVAPTPAPRRDDERYPPTQRLDHSVEDVEAVREAFGWDPEKESNFGFPDDVDATALFADLPATLRALAEQAR